jgi:nitrate reductase gamma subunit
MTTDLLLFGIFPYIAVAIAVVVTCLRPTFRTSNWHIEYFNEAIGFPEVADRALSQ